MGKERKYEFGYLSRSARIKIITAKIVVFSLTVGLLLALVLMDDLQLYRQLEIAGLVLIGVFAYLNLMDVEIDVMEVLTWDFKHRGVEFAVVAFVLNLSGFYLELTS